MHRDSGEEIVRRDFSAPEQCFTYHNSLGRTYDRTRRLVYAVKFDIDHWGLRTVTLMLEPVKVSSKFNNKEAKQQDADEEEDEGVTESEAISGAETYLSLPLDQTFRAFHYSRRHWRVMTRTALERSDRCIGDMLGDKIFLESTVLNKRTGLLRLVTST